MLLKPFDVPRVFLRGALHAHTTNSDGDWTPEMLVAKAKANGYDFLCITDHFKSEFNFPITDVSAYSDKQFTVIRSAELHIEATAAGKLWHFTANGLPKDFDPARPDETPRDYARRAADAGAFVTIVHPAWYQLTLEDAHVLDAAHAVEIMNAGCQGMHDRGDGAYLVDGLCDEGRRILCTAVDDTHAHLPDFGLAWVLVAAEDRSAESIVKALKAGRFYSTEGPEIKSMALEDNVLSIETTAAREILINGQGYANAFRCGESITRTTIDLSSLRAKSPWFRMIIIGTDGRRAWSNPMWFDALE